MALRDRLNTENKVVKERRKHPREACSEATFYAGEGGVYEGFLKDMGAKGVFVSTNEVLSIGEVITIAIPSFGGKEKTKMRGEIVRKDADGFGVHFKRYLNE